MPFKISKGSSSRISFEATPFHDGWLYFTIDDGGLYIDSEDDGIQQRTRIDPIETIEPIPNTTIQHPGHCEWHVWAGGVRYGLS